MTFRTLFFLHLFFSSWVLIGQRLPNVGMAPGIVIDTIVCDHSKEQTYAIYLPKRYDGNLSWPIIYFFEPIARGALPVKLYKEIAEEFGYILVGSNNSRNGPLADGEVAYDAIRKDTEKKLNIDQARICASGFSGGGRFSQYMAAFREELDGVIAVAGPKSHMTEGYPSTGDDILYVGIVGTRDMNFNEHIRYQQSLEDKSIASHLVIYEAGHQWPPLHEYKKTVLWIDNMYKHRNKYQTESYVLERLAEIDSIYEERPFNAYRNYQQLSANFRTTSNGKQFISIDKFFAEKEKELRKWKRANEKLLLFEREQQRRLNKALQESETSILNPSLLDSTIYTIDWWRKEVRSLKNKESKGGERGEISGRLLDHLRGFVHGVGQRGQEYNRSDLSIFANEINLMIYEKSAWFLWHHAIIYAKMDKGNQSRKYLKKAKEANEKVFFAIREYPQFTVLKGKYPFLFD